MITRKLLFLIIYIFVKLDDILDYGKWSNDQKLIKLIKVYYKTEFYDFLNYEYFRLFFNLVFKTWFYVINVTLAT